MLWSFVVYEIYVILCVVLDFRVDSWMYFVDCCFLFADLVFRLILFCETRRYLGMVLGLV